jgi:hypothetical protein
MFAEDIMGSDGWTMMLLTRLVRCEPYHNITAVYQLSDVSGIVTIIVWRVTIIGSSGMNCI